MEKSMNDKMTIYLNDLISSIIFDFIWKLFIN
jgi:hypothetical protein